ncbi:hypothetical protein HBI11_150200 [Parastagonospora nodorum]|nr:hypothetical protein HBI11_150200 [Parastagonospora nodorum]KAH6293851.1 hypothetical protein HBI39_174060 [Parastagonospora nodorum]
MSDCTLSPSASAFSSMLSAFIGSVANGLFSGFWIAFFTGWISWLAFIRILAAGFYELWLSVKAGTNPNISKADIEYESIDDAEGQFDNTSTPTHQSKSPLIMPKTPERTVHAFGWLGWIWSAVYTPISHSIWLSIHISSPHGPILLVRALAIGVSALSLTFDTKARYGARLGRGSLYLLFNLWNSFACILLGVEATILLIRGALNVSFTPIPLLVAYPVFSIIWAVVSWKFLPPIDAARPGMNTFADVAMGCFAGVFCAAPAFALYMKANFDKDVAEMGFETGEATGGVGLGEFLSCGGVSVLQKFAAIMP